MTQTLVTDATAFEATVRAAATGDEVAFGRLIAEHHAAMARVAFLVCGDSDATRDAVQAAWVAAWRQLPKLREPARIRAWLLTIAANECRKAFRGRRHERLVDISRELQGAGRAEADPEAGLDAVDLRRALSSLRTDDRMLLALRYEAGLDSTEIGRELGLSASGVRSRLARLLDRLRLDLDSSPEIDR